MIIKNLSSRITLHRYFTTYLIPFIIFLGFQLVVFNAGVYFRDEGFLTHNAIRMNQGEIPYKDFFMTTTPGSFYIQAMVMKFFGNYLILARILYIIVILAILFIMWRLFYFKPYITIALLSLISLGFVGPAYAFYNTEGLLLFLASLLFLKKALKSRHIYYFVLLGVITAGIFFIKQSYGMANIAAIVLTLYLHNKDKKQWFRDTAIYILSFCLPLCFYILYLVYNNAFNQFIYYVFSFSREVKGHRTPFILTTLACIPFYLGMLYVLRKVNLKQKAYIFSGFVLTALLLYFLISPGRLGRLFSILTDPLVYYYLALLLVPLTIISYYIKSKIAAKKELVILSFFSLSLFLASASSGRDYATILIVAPFFLPLVLLWLQQLKSKKKGWISIAIILIYIFPFLLFTYETIVATRTFTTYTGNIKPMTMIKVPQENASELEEVVSYIKSNTTPHDKIMCFPYCPLLFVLAERESASYFSFFYPETFMTSQQQEVIKQLSKEKPRMIILQRKGVIEPEADFEAKRLRVLNKYFSSNFKLVKRTQNFSFYSPPE